MGAGLLGRVRQPSLNGVMVARSSLSARIFAHGHRQPSRERHSEKGVLPVHTWVNDACSEIEPASANRFAHGATRWATHLPTCSTVWMWVSFVGPPATL